MGARTLITIYRPWAHTHGRLVIHPGYVENSARNVENSQVGGGTGSAGTSSGIHVDAGGRGDGQMVGEDTQQAGGAAPRA